MSFKIEQLTRLTEEEINSMHDNNLAYRLIFLWDLRELDIKTYQKNALGIEKEYIYRVHPNIVTLAYQIIRKG